MSETELLPCPFCGGSADFARVTRGFGVIAGCNLCQASVFAIDENNPSDVANHQKLASAAWNKRVAIPRATTQPFTPDWDLLEATQASLREHMAIAKAAQEREQRFRAEVAAALCELRELRNGLECIQERAQRMRGSASGDRPMKSATQACAWIAESTPALLKQIDATIAKLGLEEM